MKPCLSAKYKPITDVQKSPWPTPLPMDGNQKGSKKEVRAVDSVLFYGLRQIYEEKSRDFSFPSTTVIIKWNHVKGTWQTINHKTKLKVLLSLLREAFIYLNHFVLQMETIHFFSKLLWIRCLSLLLESGRLLLHGSLLGEFLLDLMIWQLHSILSIKDAQFIGLPELLKSLLIIILMKTSVWKSSVYNPFSVIYIKYQYSVHSSKLYC